MRKLNWLFAAILLAMIPALQACDDGDGYSIGDQGRDWATVRTLGGDAFYLEGDTWGSMLLLSPVWNYKPIDGQRVVVRFNPLYDDYEGYDLAIRLDRMREVLTKSVEELTAENEKEFGNDPVAIWQNDMWISGGYLNVVFQQNLPNHEKHLVSLVRNTTVEHPADGYIHLEYRYNTYGDLSGFWQDGVVSFSLKSLGIDEQTKGIKVKINSHENGEVELTFPVKGVNLPKSIENMELTIQKDDKLK